ncbi:hypothetical protein H9P43_005305 [Blastocladiella emersonii ATCC 22665]|nr:hypothetical protein H9P43_005305 [Blastocladiella emersonii ATCC 22665]
MAEQMMPRRSRAAVRDAPPAHVSDTEEDASDETTASTSLAAGVPSAVDRAELHALRDASLDAFASLVCRIVGEARTADASRAGTVSPPTSAIAACFDLPPSPPPPAPASHLAPALSAEALLAAAPPPPAHTPGADVRRGSATAAARNLLSTLRRGSTGDAAAAAALLRRRSIGVLPSAALAQEYAPPPAAPSSLPFDPPALAQPPPTLAYPTATAAPASPGGGMMSSLRTRIRSLSNPAQYPPELALASPSTTSSAAALVNPRADRDDEGCASATSVAVKPPAPAAPLVPDTALASALASLLDDVYLLLENPTEPTPEQWAHVESAMGTVAVLAEARRGRPLPALTTDSENLSHPSSPLHPPHLLDAARPSSNGSAFSEALRASAPPSFSLDHPPPGYHESLDTLASSGDAKHLLASHNAKHALDAKSRAAPPAVAAPAATTDDLDRVLAVIDRLQRRGRLEDQTTHLSPAKRDAMDQAATASHIARLTRGRLDNQRAASTADEQQALMTALIDSAASRSMANQRATMSDATVRRVELARLAAAADRLARVGRMHDQDATPRRVRELDHLATELSRLARGTPALDSQRFTMTESKEKAMYLSQVAHRVARLNDRRLDNQAADGPQARRVRAFNEVDAVMERMFKDGHQLDEQRFHVALPSPALP